MTKQDTFPVRLTVGICLALAAAVGGYLWWFYSTKAKGLDFAERLAHATGAARERAADAELSRASIYYVNSSGHVELPNKGAGSRDTHPIGIIFRFRSPKLAAAPAAGQLGGPAQADTGAGAGCIIEITARGPATRGLDLRIRQKDDATPGCGESLPAPPRCSLAQVWSAAIARGAPRDALADIELAVIHGTYSWTFTITDWNHQAAKPVFQADIADDCAK